MKQLEESIPSEELKSLKDCKTEEQCANFIANSFLTEYPENQKGFVTPKVIRDTLREMILLALKWKRKTMTVSKSILVQEVKPISDLEKHINKAGFDAYFQETTLPQSTGLSLQECSPIGKLIWLMSDGLGSLDESVKISEIWSEAHKLLESQQQPQQTECNHDNSVWDAQGYTLYCRDCKATINDRIDVKIQQTEWTYVNDGLPNKEGYYLCGKQYRFNKIFIQAVYEFRFSRMRATGELVVDEDGITGHFQDGLGYGQDVTHWMPLPEEPKTIYGN